MNTSIEATVFIKKAAKEDLKVLYHSGDASCHDSLSSGIEASFGPWLEEVLISATDDDEFAQEIRESNKSSFFAESPEWVAIKAARACGKNLSNITLKDIEEHGQLCIVGVDPDDTDFKVSDGEGGCRYLNGEVAYDDVPFGVETGDVFSTAPFNPIDISLKGSELISFLMENFPELNNIKDLQKELESSKENEMTMNPGMSITLG